MLETYPQLPLSNLHARFCEALQASSLLLEAEPGAGKSTLAPLWALDSLAGEVWLVQPRVLAAVSLADRLAQLRGETVGHTVGYQVPFNNRTSRHTRLRLMTPGVFLQRLLADPELAGVSCVMLDEIHERSVDQDMAWAMLQEVMVLRDELSVVLMSATPDAALRKQVDIALYSPGRCFPVDISYCPPTQQMPTNRPEPLATHLLRALKKEDWQAQTLLVFLPGWRDITACKQALCESYPNHPVYCLHSRVDSAEQTRALDATLGPRVILATNIAETSLTIADVTLVVDAGLVREPDFEQSTGVTRLQTRRIAAASAEQRRGRAGRVQAGRCIRLWSESEALAPQTLPAIRRCDYLPLALRLAHWGTPSALLPWLEAPNPIAIQTAIERLQRWEFVQANGTITALGEQVARLGTHPRTAALLLHSADALADSPWLLLLALALHFDLPVEPLLSLWMEQALQAWQHQKKWRKQAQRWQKVLKVEVQPDATITGLPAELTDKLAGLLVDRLGHRTAAGRYRLTSGISVALDCEADWALVLQLSRRGKGHVGAGVAITPSDARIRELAVPTRQLQQTGNGQRRRWVEYTAYYLGDQLVEDNQRQLKAAEIPAAILAYIQQTGLAQLVWPQSALNLLLRARWASRLELLTLPALTAEQLSADIDKWLAGFLQAGTNINQLPLKDALTFYLGFDVVQQLDRLVPETVTLPSGRKVPIDYQTDTSTAALVAGEVLPMPSIAAKLQEFFSAEKLDAGQLPLSIKLLSPAGRPLAITQDLAYFWREVYPQVRREVRGRYAKHPWPKDPFTHPPTRFTKKRLQKE